MARFFGLVFFSAYCGPFRVGVLVGLAGTIAAIALQLILPGDEGEPGQEADADAEPAEKETKVRPCLSTSLSAPPALRDQTASLG